MYYNIHICTYKGTWITSKGNNLDLVPNKMFFFYSVGYAIKFLHFIILCFEAICRKLKSRNFICNNRYTHTTIYKKCVLGRFVYS